MNEKAKRIFLDFCLSVAGSALTGISIALFTAPNRIAPGGLSGLATVVSYLTGGKIGIGMLTFLFKAPIMAYGIKKLGLRPILMTIFSALILSVFIDLFAYLLPAYTGNTLMAAMAGGVLSGAGAGIMFTRSISMGGTDLLSLCLKKSFPSFPVGRILMVLDGTVVLIAVAVFHDFEVALYSIFCIFVTTKVIDAIIQGLDYAKIIYVVTEKGEEISHVLMEEGGRSVTVIPSKGGYSKRDKKLLLVAVSRNEFSETIRLIRTADEDSFVFSVSASEVHGGSFRSARRDS